MKQKGLTLIELLIAMTITALLGAGVYRTFVGQQHTYQVQEDLVDVQQNVRMAISQMVRDIRMAGFGFGDDEKKGLNSIAKGKSGMLGKYNSIVNPGVDNITVIAGYSQVGTVLADTGSGNPTIQISCPGLFDGNGPKQYICINGTESHRVKKVDGNTIEFFTDNGVGNGGGDRLSDDHKAGEPIFMLKALSYSIGAQDGKMCLLRDENLGDGPQPVAENIESLHFVYTIREDTGALVVYDGNVPGNKTDKIRMVQVRIVAKTDKQDKDFMKASDGYRRRALSSEIQLRNLMGI